MIPLSGRVPGRASEPSRTRVDDGGGYGMFPGKMFGVLGFSRGRHYIGERATSVGARGAHTTWRRGQGGCRATTRCGCLVAPSYSSSVFWILPRKIWTLAFISCNSENISLTTFMKPKTAEKQELALWHLVNRLVPENA